MDESAERGAGLGVIVGPLAVNIPNNGYCTAWRKFTCFEVVGIGAKFEPFVVLLHGTGCILLRPSHFAFGLVGQVQALILHCGWGVVEVLF